MFSLQIACPIEMIKNWEFLGADLLFHWEYFRCPKWTVISPKKMSFIYSKWPSNFLYQWQKKWLSDWEITEGQKSPFHPLISIRGHGHFDRKGRRSHFRYESSHIHRKGKFGIEKGQAYRTLMCGDIENHANGTAHIFPQKTRARPGWMEQYFHPKDR